MLASTLALGLALTLAAAPPAFTKVKDTSKLPHVPGLELEDEEVYALSSPPLAGTVVALASAARGDGAGTGRPSLVLIRGEKVEKVIALPGLLEGWNLVQVDAVSFADVNRDGRTDVLCVVTLEPLSGRSADYWQQAFVFLADEKELLRADAELNRKLADAKPRPATIAQAKKLLATKR